ncbi:MAG: TIGR02996 domain-containing protein [Planctomycetes bacterium]|nr:TIGR02996 domain-containing protein [Planctomycetota bacterium]
MAKKKKPEPPPADPWDETYIESLAVDEKQVKESRKVLNKGGFGKVESRADGRGWWVECRGMTGTYQVSARPDPEAGFVATCTCPSRQNPCKHALALLLYLAAHPDERVEPVAASSAKSVDLDALVRAVFDSPDDDTPRLVLADCAEELGQPARAALIRLQCEKARLKPAAARSRQLDAEEKALMPAVRAEMGPIPDGMTAAFHRGFATLQMNGRWWGCELDALPAKFPELFRDGWVEVASVIHAQAMPLWLIGLLRQVREVDFSHAPAYSQLGDRELVRIASDLQPGRDGARLRSVQVPAEWRPRFRDLTAAAATGAAPGTEGEHLLRPPLVDGSGRFDDLNPAQFALLLRAGHMRGAQDLTLNGEIGAAGIRALLAAPEIDDLTSLHLTNSGVGPDGLAELATSPDAERLEWLTIRGAPDGDALAAALSGGKWTHLEQLGLCSVGLTDAGADALSRCQFPALKALHLFGNALTRAGVALLLDAARLAGVKDWTFTGNPITAGEWLPLVLSGTRTGGTVNFGPVTAELSHTLNKSDELHLRLTGSREPAPELFDAWATAARPVTSAVLSKLRFDAVGIVQLCSALAAHKVRELHINDCELRNEAAVTLANRLPDLKLGVLDLRDNEVGKAGAEALAAARGLATVRVLELSGNPLRPSGVDALVASPHLKSLERITLPGKDIPAKRQKEIRARLGKGVVVEFG